MEPDSCVCSRGRTAVDAAEFRPVGHVRLHDGRIERPGFDAYLLVIDKPVLVIVKQQLDVCVSAGIDHVGHPGVGGDAVVTSAPDLQGLHPGAVEMLAIVVSDHEASVSVRSAVATDFESRGSLVAVPEGSPALELDRIDGESGRPQECRRPTGQLKSDSAHNIASWAI